MKLSELIREIKRTTREYGVEVYLERQHFRCRKLGGEQLLGSLYGWVRQQIYINGGNTIDVFDVATAGPVTARHYSGPFRKRARLLRRILINTFNLEKGIV